MVNTEIKKRDNFKQGSQRAATLAWGLLIFAFPFIIYANSLHNDFLAGDDEEIILRNQYLLSHKYIPKFFTENFKAGSGNISNFWRPFQLLVYFLIIHTVGLKPLPFHIISIFFHSLCGLFLFWLFWWLFSKKVPLPIIALVVLLWLAHPLHNAELAVTSGIASPAHLFWMLGGLFAFIRFAEGRAGGWLFLSAVSFMLSLASKESAIVFPGLLLAMHITACKVSIFKKSGLREFISKHILFWIIALIYVSARLSILNFQNTLNFYNQTNIFTENFSFRLYTLFTILTHGLRIIFIPAGLHPEKSWPVFTEFFCPEVFLSFFILSIIFILAIIGWKKNPLFSLGIFWFFFSYFPMSNLVAMIHSLIWDHWFYTPSIGILLSLTALIQRRFIQKAAFFVLIPALIIFSAISIARNPFWKDTETVSRYILSYEPQTVKTWNNLGLALAKKGKHQQAINCYLTAIKLADVYPQTHHNLANEYLALGKYALAENEYQKALNMDNNFYHAYLGLGNLYLARGQREEAIKYFRRALAIYPYLPQVKEFLSKAGK